MPYPVSAWRETKAVNLDRYLIADDEWVTIVEGFAMVVHSTDALLVDGVLEINGLLFVE